MNPNATLALSIAAFCIAGFFIARRLLDRNRARLERRLTFPKTDRIEEIMAARASPTIGTRVDRSFEFMLQRSGLGLSTAQALLLCGLTALTLAALLFFWREDEGAAALGLAAGMALPLFVLWFLQGRRTRLLQGQLPDAFFFLARSLRAGLSLEQALVAAGQQLDDPLADEFRRASGQIQLGLHPVTALENMAGRLRLTDVDIFVSTVGLYYQSGGNLALLLDRLAAGTRDRIQFQGFFRAATALGRVAGIVLGSAVPLLVIGYAIFQPEPFSEIFRTAEGLQLLAIAAVLEVIGILWFMYLLRIDY